MTNRTMIYCTTGRWGFAPLGYWCEQPGEGAGRYTRTILERAVMALKWYESWQVGSVVAAYL